MTENQELRLFFTAWPIVGISIVELSMWYHDELNVEKGLLLGFSAIITSAIIYAVGPVLESSAHRAATGHEMRPGCCGPSEDGKKDEEIEAEVKRLADAMMGGVPDLQSLGALPKRLPRSVVEQIARERVMQVRDRNARDAE